MHGEFEFRDHVEVTEIGPFRITTALMNHPVPCYASRVEAGGAVAGLQRRHRRERRRSSSSRAAPTSRCPRRRSSAGDDNLPPNLHMTATEAGEHAHARRRRPAGAHAPRAVDAARRDAVAEAAPVFDGRARPRHPGLVLDGLIAAD